VNISEDLEAIRRLLTESRTIAVVGLSPKPDRDSNDVARYLIDQGYEVIPVNPGQHEILGRKCRASIPEGVDIVDVFRRPEHMPAVVEEAIRAKAKAVWMQLETGNEEAARRAAGAGLTVVVEKCIKVAHKVLRIPKKGDDLLPGHGY
jgi:hypothetical protein